jgi:hypothetical protein
MLPSNMILSVLTFYFHLIHFFSAIDSGIIINP